MDNLIIKLMGFELKALKENGILIKKVPFITKDGRICTKRIPTKIFPDNVDAYGNIIIQRKGGRVKPVRR